MVSRRVLTAVASAMRGTGRSSAGSELVSATFSLAYAELHQIERFVPQHDLFAGVIPKVHDQVGSFSRARESES